MIAHITSKSFAKSQDPYLIKDENPLLTMVSLNHIQLN
jgi:hypothetical protein